MTKAIEIIRNTRLHLLDVIKDLSVEQLNKIPAGFNNNIIWNLTHLISAQQSICYKRSGVDVKIEERFFMPYQPGTKPDRFIDADEINTIKELFLSTIDLLEADLQTDVFANYTPWNTRYNVSMNNIEEVMGFLPYHEGLHSGYIWAMKRTI